MREADRLELKLSSGNTPFESIRKCMETASAYVGLADGIPVVIFGCVPSPFAADWGYPWMLGTDDIRKIKLEFLRTSVKVVDQWQSEYRVLSNFVYSGNSLSKLWLKHLGFVLFPAQPFGISGAPFNQFMRIA